MRVTKRRAVLAVLGPALVLLGLTTQTWVSGTARDVLSAGPVDVSGAAAAPGVVGVTIVCVVALLGLLTGGRVIRAVSAVFLVLAALGALTFVVLVVTRPTETVASQVARQLARTTAPDATGSATALAWLAAVVAVLLVLGALVTAIASRSWAGLSGRYERGSAAQRGPRGEVRTVWDELSDGRDPTLRDGPDAT